jgi:hypothetical protein
MRTVATGSGDNYPDSTCKPIVGQKSYKSNGHYATKYSDFPKLINTLVVALLAVQIPLPSLFDEYWT